MDRKRFNKRYNNHNVRDYQDNWSYDNTGFSTYRARYKRNKGLFSILSNLMRYGRLSKNIWS